MLPAVKSKQKFKIFNLFRISKENGFGLVEIIVVTAVVLTALAGFLETETVSTKLLRTEKENLEAAFLAQEGLEAVKSLRDESWSQNIAPRISGTFYYLLIQNNKWTLTTSLPPLLNNKYTRVVIFENVFRDGQDKIAPSGTPDPGTRKITVRISWLAAAGNRQLEYSSYLTDFQNYISRLKDYGLGLIVFQHAPDKKI